MHAISFQLKRAHLVTTRFAQRAVEDIEGMTPARYDVLALIRQKGIRAGWPQSNLLNSMAQRDIVRWLGLHPSTASIMLKKMEQLGWITRERDKHNGDNRVRLVTMTELGFRVTWRAMRRVYRMRLLLTPYERIVRQLRPLDHVLEGIEYVWGTIDGIARFFGDESSHFYPWGRSRMGNELAREPTDSARTIFDHLTRSWRRRLDARWLALAKARARSRALAADLQRPRVCDCECECDCVEPCDCDCTCDLEPPRAAPPRTRRG